MSVRNPTHGRRGSPAYCTTIIQTLASATSRVTNFKQACRQLTENSAATIRQPRRSEDKCARIDNSKCRYRAELSRSLEAASRANEMREQLRTPEAQGPTRIPCDTRTQRPLRSKEEAGLPGDGRIGRWDAWRPGLWSPIQPRSSPAGASPPSLRLSVKLNAVRVETSQQSVSQPSLWPSGHCRSTSTARPPMFGPSAHFTGDRLMGWVCFLAAHLGLTRPRPTGGVC